VPYFTKVKNKNRVGPLYGYETHIYYLMLMVLLLIFGSFHSPNQYLLTTVLAVFLG